MHALTLDADQEEAAARRTTKLFQEQLDADRKETDLKFAWLMALQWVAGMVAALWISPRTWEGQYSETNIHVWAALFLGGMISGFPIYLALSFPGEVLTRHMIAVGQMLSCGLLIHLTGGRIESHFQYFGTLAFLSFYRDWRVLFTASLVAAADHFIRGYFWPESMFGLLIVSIWRPVEHVSWILFEDIFLVLAIRQSLQQMLGMAAQQAQLEIVNEVIERKVEERTREMKKEIVERKKAEEARKLIENRLLESQNLKTVGRLAGGVAHEFNSILTAIIGQSELLLSDLPPDNPITNSAREIRRAADRAATLTRQLLAFGRKQILQPVVLNINRTLSDMMGTLQHLMGREVDVRITPAIGIKSVKIDPGQLEHVIVNLAMNAADAMPNGGTFTLETANVTLDENYVSPFPGLKAGGYVMLAMTDTGFGMTDEVKARIFEPFFSTKGVGQGTGLGLATTYGIIKQSNGHINVYSEVARGTTFKIYLPQYESESKLKLPRLESPVLPRGTETILMAEDDPSLLEMSSTLLRRLGYTVLTAANGIEALNLKNQKDIGHIDLLLTDVTMPHMSGKELSERIRSIYPYTKILFTSAYTENAIVHQGVLNPGVALLPKPFTPAALANRVREVLDRPSPA